MLTWEYWCYLDGDVLEIPPHPVTTRIMTFWVGNPYKPCWLAFLGRERTPMASWKWMMWFSWSCLDVKWRCAWWCWMMSFPSRNVLIIWKVWLEDMILQFFAVLARIPRHHDSVETGDVWDVYLEGPFFHFHDLWGGRVNRMRRVVLYDPAYSQEMAAPGVFARASRPQSQRGPTWRIFSPGISHRTWRTGRLG